MFELENSPHEFSSMGNFKTIKKKEYFGLNSFFMSDVSLGVAFVVLDVLIATSPPPPFKVILGDNLSAGAIIGVGDCKRGVHTVPSK